MRREESVLMIYNQVSISQTNNEIIVERRQYLNEIIDCK